jgi:hypothetical protein
MSNRDYVRLQHMLDASQAAVSHLLGKCREDLDHSRLLLKESLPPLISQLEQILQNWPRENP